jgi:hypothetical protein
MSSTRDGRPEPRDPQLDSAAKTLRLVNGGRPRRLSGAEVAALTRDRVEAWRADHSPALDNINALRPRGRQTPGPVEQWLASAALRVRVWADRSDLTVLVWTCVMAVGIAFVIAGLARLGWSLGR